MNLPALSFLMDPDPGKSSGSGSTTLVELCTRDETVQQRAAAKPYVIHPSDAVLSHRHR